MNNGIVKKLEGRIEELESKLETIYIEANNLIYFDDLKNRNVHNLVACIASECGEKEGYYTGEKYLEKGQTNETT